MMMMALCINLDEDISWWIKIPAWAFILWSIFVIPYAIGYVRGQIQVKARLRALGHME